MSAIILYVTIGFVLTGLVALKPKRFWPLLIIVTVGTAGIMVGGKYTFLDEYLTACILFGGFLALSLGAVHLRKERENIWEQFHKWVFLLMVGYMIVQSLQGLMVLESLRKIRWVVYYGMLGITAFMVSNKGFPVPSRRKVSLIVSGSALVYLISYLLHGLLTETLRGISRFEVQPGEWSTTAYALFPLVIAIPSAIFLFGDRDYKYRLVGWATLIAGILAAFYYYSRTSWLVIFAFLFIALFKLGLRKVLLLLLCFLLVFGLYFGTGNRGELTRRANSFLGELSRSAQSIRFWDVSSRTDIDRKVHLQVGFISVAENWKTFLFGYGFRTHGIVISPYLKRLYEDHGLPQLAAKVKDDEGTEGFTALLVDTGWVGMLLLGMNFLFVAHKILIQKKNPNRIILLLSLFFAFLWLPVINMVDIMLFYLLIMPGGLLVQLSRHKMVEETS